MYIAYTKEVMTLPPTIPTSFVPRITSAAPRQFRSDFIGVFSFFAYGVLVIAVVLALGIFLYGRVLDSNKVAKDTALANAQAAIDRTTVENFVRLRNRLTSSESLLDKHAAPSSFFSAIEAILPENVRFSSMHLSLVDAGATIDGSGTAKNFNALAAASNAFATEGHIRDAIFSKISINRDNSVSFALSATLDPRILIFTPSIADPSSVLEIHQGDSLPPQ